MKLTEALLSIASSSRLARLSRSDAHAGIDSTWTIFNSISRR